MYYKACTITFQYYCVLQSLQKHIPVRGVATFPIDTATPEDKQRRRFCSFPIETATPAEKQRVRCFSFPHRHGDVCAAKRTRFCSFPHRHGINVAKNDAKKDAKRRADQLEANKADPQTINGNPLLRIREKTKKCSRICALENVSDSGSEYPPKKMVDAFSRRF